MIRYISVWADFSNFIILFTLKIQKHFINVSFRTLETMPPVSSNTDITCHVHAIKRHQKLHYL